MNSVASPQLDGDFREELFAEVLIERLCDTRRQCASHCLSGPHDRQSIRQLGPPRCIRHRAPDHLRAATDRSRWLKVRTERVGFRRPLAPCIFELSGFALPGLRTLAQAARLGLIRWPSSVWLQFPNV